MAELMKAYILTPNGPVFEGEVTGVQMPGAEGGFEVRYNHAKMVSLLDVGKLVVSSADGSALVYAIGGGFAEVSENVITVMAEEAIPADKIDSKKDIERKSVVESELKKLNIDSDEHKKAESELKRLSNRISIASN